MDELAELQRQLSFHNNQINEIEAKIRKIKLEQTMARWGVFPGCVVTADGKYFKVVGIETDRTNKPWLTGHPRKKDGTWGTALRNLYSSWNWRLR